MLERERQRARAIAQAVPHPDRGHDLRRRAAQRRDGARSAGVMDAKVGCYHMRNVEHCGSIYNFDDDVGAGAMTAPVPLDAGGMYGKNRLNRNFEHHLKYDLLATTSGVSYPAPGEHGWGRLRD